MPQPPRFHVVVRFGGRIVDDRCVAGRLSLGDGGDVVVPGLGDAVVLLDAGRLCALDGLDAVIVRGDEREALGQAGIALVEGERAVLSSRAHEGLEITVERISDERVTVRDRFFTVPARETIFAGALAGCLAMMLGGKVVIGALTEPEVEREREQTALELAMFEAVPVIPVTLPPIVVYVPPVVVPPPPPPPLELHSNATVLADASVSAIPTDLFEARGEEIVSPEAVEVPEAAPSKKRARVRRARTDELEQILDQVMVTELSALNTSVESGTLSLLASKSEPGSLVEVIRSDAAGSDALVATGRGGGIGELDLGRPGAGGYAGGTAVAIDTPAPAGAHAEAMPEKVLKQVETTTPPELAPNLVEAAPAPEPVKVDTQPGPVGARAIPIQAIVAAPAADPRGGTFALADAFAGDEGLAKGTGKLTAVLTTSKGKITCELFEDRAPITVANFVGLARGTRESLDLDTGRWRKKRFYDGLIFHRVVDNFVIQGGDPRGEGKDGPGYEIADEHHADLTHDGAGVLAMANKGPNTGGSQFFITLGPTPHLDGKHSIFGKCDTRVAQRIAKVPVDDTRQHRPLEPVTIVKVVIGRVAEPEPEPTEVRPMILVGPRDEPPPVELTPPTDDEPF